MANAVLDFEKDVIEASKSKPIVVDFWAEWCGPCKVLGPVLEKLAEEANGSWTLVKVDTEKYPQMAMQYRVQGIPAVKMFSDGEVVAEFVGALPETQVRRWLEEHIPTESKRILAEANDAVTRGETEKARKLFEQVLEAEPENADARVPLAELLFQDDPQRSFDLVQNVPQEHPLHSRAEAILTLAGLLQNHGVLQEKAEAATESAEAWSYYLAGIEALQRRDYEQALTSWIDSVLSDRSIDDDGPRRACVALFTWLGQDHELTRKHHRAFTSALF